MVLEKTVRTFLHEVAKEVLTGEERMKEPQKVILLPKTRKEKIVVEVAWLALVTEVEEEEEATLVEEEGVLEALEAVVASETSTEEVAVTDRE